MSANPELLEGGTDEGPTPSRRRPLVLVLVGVLFVLAVAAGLVAVLRDDAPVGEDESAVTVTFGPEGDATTIPEPPLGSRPVIALSVDSGPAGSEVTLQGTSFKLGRAFTPVEVYWDRVGGEKLKTVDGPRFSVKLKIPEDAPVVTEGHNVIAVQRTKDGELLSQTSARFFVLPKR